MSLLFAKIKTNYSGDKIFRILLLLFFYMVLSTIITFVFVNYHWNVHRNAEFSNLVNRTAHRPYVARVLLPYTINVISTHTTQTLKDQINGLISTTGIFNNVFRSEYSFEFLVALPIIFLCFLGLHYLLRALALVFYPNPHFVPDFAPLVGMLTLPLLFVTYDHYVYDPGTLFFFTLSVYLISTRRFLLFYPAFLLATFNKETSILLIGVFFIHEFRAMKRSTLIQHILLQLVIWIGIRIYIAFLFKDNPGAFAEFHLINHTLILLSHPREIVYALAVALFATLLVKYGWKQKPVFLRHSFLLVLTIQVTLALVFGFIEEIRAYYEVFPFFFLLCIPSIMNIFGVYPQSKTI